MRSYVEMSKRPESRSLLNRAADGSEREKLGQLLKDDPVFVVLSAKTLDDGAVEGQVNRNVKVLAVLPTMVGRRTYDLSPAELAKRQGVFPVDDKGRASAADRVFGYVVPSPQYKCGGFVQCCHQQGPERASSSAFS